MYKLSVSFKDRLSIFKAQEVLSKLYYSLENIDKCYIDFEKEEFIVETQNVNSSFEEIVEEVIAEQSSYREFKPKQIKSNNPDFNIQDVHIIEDADYKKIVNSEEGIKVYKALDLIFEKISKKHEAKYRKYSSLISRKTMNRCNYVHTFPQNIMFSSEFPHNLNVLKEVKSNTNYEKFAVISDDVLSPAVCFHTYDEYKDSIQNFPVVITAVESCFRNEAKWRVGNYRKKEFLMREIVYIGNSKFVDEIREQIMSEVWDLFCLFNFTGDVETANDPFYFSEDKNKGLYQHLAKTKYELVISLPTKESFSIASFNNVGNTLCKEFNIRTSNDEFLYSGCVAFGIDRWVYAFFSLYGLNVNLWPQDIKSILFDNKELCQSSK